MTGSDSVYSPNDTPLGQLINAVTFSMQRRSKGEIVRRGRTESPNLMLIGQRTAKFVGTTSGRHPNIFEDVLMDHELIISDFIVEELARTSVVRQLAEIKSPAPGGAIADDERLSGFLASTGETHTDEASA
ncbi:MAG: hypothetical protein WD078_14115 [Woeseia sp.]